ncbi:hypothetical protein [Mycetocola sp. 2940]|uniref:hypothetical protein n=1 Tax=Mycetocola sp. 2940 TaxID=3156452 RepID=UPI003393D644
MDDLWSAILGAVVSGTVIAALVGLLTRRSEARIKESVAAEFRAIAEARDADRALLAEVLGPVCAHLARTRQAFGRWRSRNLHLETRIMADSNETIRRILLEKYHLLTPELRPPAMKLVEHYDKWFEVYERERNSGKPEAEQASFIFAGPEGYKFPKESEVEFREALDAVDARLRGAKPTKSAEPV